MTTSPKSPGKRRADEMSSDSEEQAPRWAPGYIEPGEHADNANDENESLVVVNGVDPMEEMQELPRSRTMSAGPESTTVDRMDMDLDLVVEEEEKKRGRKQVGFTD